LIEKGKKCVVVSIGNQLVRAINYSKQRKGCTVYNARFAKPIDQQMISSIRKTKEAVIFEENSKIGGFSSAILEELAKQKISARVKIVGLEDRFIEHGDVAQLRKRYLV
jgi:1-deoxy-D-xylulose-5-phosphate synthase